MSASDAGAGHKVTPFQVALLVFTLLVLCSLVADTVLGLPAQRRLLLRRHNDRKASSPPAGQAHRARRRPSPKPGEERTQPQLDAPL